MYILAVETSAVAASAALLKDSALVSESFVNIGLTHSQTLMTLVDTCLSNAGVTVKDVDIFACANGPGSFTGIRIGVSAVKGLAFTDDKPVYGISTLEAMAYSAAVEGYVICPVMDARCHQVYTAQFEAENGKIKRLTADEPLKLEELEERLKAIGKKVLFLGDGTGVALKYFENTDVDFTVFPEIYKYQHAGAVAFAAFVRYNNGEAPLSGAGLLPSYLRLSQAERERNNKKGE